MKTYSVNFQFTIHIPLKENEPAKVGFQRRNRMIAKIAKNLEEEGIASEISYRKAILREDKMKKKYELDISESGYQVIEIDRLGRETSLGLFHTREEADRIMEENIKAQEELINEAG